MAPSVVHLHIGSSKTGTSFIQRVLWMNRKRLADDGVLVPGQRRSDAWQAARDLVRWNGSDADPLPESWQTLAQEINRSRQDSVVISQEFLCWLRTGNIEQMLAPLAKSHIKVILTTRDLARLIPAQWQSAIRQRNTWTLTDYAEAVAGQARSGERHPAYRHFWKRQDTNSILAQWAAAVGAENICVITVPRSGSDPTELWQRFCRATALSGGRYETAGAANTSLGATSSEVLRRINVVEAIQDMSRESYRAEVNRTLSRLVLDLRADQEPRLSLPEAQRAWVATKAEEIIQAIESAGVNVMGSVAELRPDPISVPYQAPEDLPLEDLLAAAIDGLAGLVLARATQDDAKPPDE